MVDTKLTSRLNSRRNKISQFGEIRRFNFLVPKYLTSTRLTFYSTNSSLDFIKFSSKRSKNVLKIGSHINEQIMTDINESLNDFFQKLINNHQSIYRQQIIPLSRRLHNDNSDFHSYAPCKLVTIQFSHDQQLGDVST